MELSVHSEERCMGFYFCFDLLFFNFLIFAWSGMSSQTGYHPKPGTTEIPTKQRIRTGTRDIYYGGHIVCLIFISSRHVVYLTRLPGSMVRLVLSLISFPPFFFFFFSSFYFFFHALYITIVLLFSAWLIRFDSTKPLHLSMFPSSYDAGLWWLYRIDSLA